MTYVDFSNRQHEVRCTRAVYSEINVEGYARMFNKDFYLTMDAEGVVDHIDVQPKVRAGEVFEEQHETSQDHLDVVILEKTTDGKSYNIRIKPASVGRDVADKIREKLNAHGGEIKPRDIIGEQWFVNDVRDNGKRVHINVNPV